MAKKIVSVVDDEKNITHLLKSLLTKAGYEVSMARDGQEGLDMINETSPDLILLDIMMPKLDGYEVLRTLKGNQITKDIPVVMLSARSLEEEIQKGLDLGADDYITKPFYGKLLIKRVQSILAKKLEENKYV